MFNYTELRNVQIEITNRCQASCPMCLRNINGGIPNPNLRFNDWSFEDFKNIFKNGILKKLESIDICGDFGDPILNNDLIEMCRYIRQENPNIYLSIFTNGSARNHDWWISLAESLPLNHKVEFALDGLEDTHHLYRVGTDFNKIIQNAKSFISAGGKATWMFIRFKHNEHQVQEAKDTAKEIGFSNFAVKNSKRFGKTFTVLDKNGNISHYLDQPEYSPIKFVDKSDLENYQNWNNAKDIECFVLDRKEIYIDAHYTVMPCCLLGSFLYANYDKELYIKYKVYDESSLVDAGNLAQKETYRIINELGGIKNLNALDIGIEKILSNPTWQSIWYREWENKTSPVCVILCSKDTPFTRIENQIKENVSI